MALKVAFQMEEMSDKIARDSTSLGMMLEAQKRGHIIYNYQPKDLTLTNNRVFARARKVELDMKSSPYYSLGKTEIIDLTLIDVVHMRQNPPFNMEYITASLMLEAIMSRTLVLNDPISVRNAPEKLLPFAFGDFIPPTVVTEDFQAAKDFLAAQKELVIKPLYMFGGNDVHKITKDTKDFKALFTKMVKKHQAPLVVQKLIPAIAEGDKRIILLDGEVQGAYLRVPKKGSILANYHMGATLHKTEITKRERDICKALGPVLKKRGLLLCDIDVIGGYLTEINITSPGGMKLLDNLYKINITGKFWDAVEAKLNG